jgi:hypothetical protein
MGWVHLRLSTVEPDASVGRVVMVIRFAPAPSWPDVRRLANEDLGQAARTCPPSCKSSPSPGNVPGHHNAPSGTGARL